MARFVIIVVTVNVLLLGADVFAAGRRQQRMLDRTEGVETPRMPAYDRSATMDTGRYPKFKGAFHSRDLQNIGTPSGDAGLRGNGISMYPW